MKLDILAVASHPDDVEMSCGGTVIKHTMQGDKVGLVDLTRGELGTRGSKEIRDQEAKDAAVILGIQVRENLDLGDGRFQNTTENQLKLIALIRKYQPDVLLGPAIFDRHPDHGKGANLVRDAWFYAGIKNMKTFDEQGNPQAAWRPRLLLHYIQDRWIKPDIVVDVSAVFDKKAYKSENELKSISSASSSNKSLIKLLLKIKKVMIKKIVNLVAIMNYRIIINLLFI